MHTTNRQPRANVTMPTRGLAPLVAGALVLAASAPALSYGKPEMITGKLSKSGYTVLAVAKGGKATSKRVGTSRFKLRPPAEKVTLHLRARDGTYAGPIVMRKQRDGKRAILGVVAGAKLGRIVVRSTAGYAKPAVSPAPRYVDTDRWARARRGVPIGAGKFGLVRSRKTKGGTPGDRDLDGISNPLDVDDDGDGVLDNIDSSGAASASSLGRAHAAQTAEGFLLFPFYNLGIDTTTNVHAMALTPAGSDARLAMDGIVIVNRLADGAELDCRGLSYCTSGGTGNLVLLDEAGHPSVKSKFPEAHDADGDGFGTLVPGAGGGTFLHPGATTAEIKTGDLLIQRVTSGGVETQYPATLQYVFATVPALVSYGDTAGNSATVAYPVAFQSGSGAMTNGFPVAPGDDGRIVLTFTFWRPQRARTPGDPGENSWIDIGGLTYEIEFFNREGIGCGPQSAYSTTDPNLAPRPALPPSADSSVPDGGFSDLAPDRTADAANKLQFTLDLSACLKERKVAFKPGDELGLNLNAIAGDGPDYASQTFFVRRAPSR